MAKTSTDPVCDTQRPGGGLSCAYGNSHSVDGLIIADELGVDIASGLSLEEADKRLNQDGPNVLAKISGPGLLRVFLRQFANIVVWLLLAASVVAWFTNGIPEAVAIFTVLIINAVVGFVIEWRAGKAIDALKDQTRIAARVRRGGLESVVDAVNLVVGDIVILAAGDRVPADARLLEAVNLQADESALTGESFPVSKSIESVSFSSILTERRSMLHLGTVVTSGRALAIVTATGPQTELGHVGRLLAETEDEHTPLERRLAWLGKILVYIVLAIAVIVMLAGLLRGDDPAMMLEVSISLAVAAIPEGLPAITTLILALGVLRMAQRRAIVRKLSAVEALGSTTVICTDKTGTLTENRMTVTEYGLADGNVVEPGEGETSNDILKRLMLVSVLCNDAAFDSDASGKETVGDPTEIALLVAARDLLPDMAAVRGSFEKIRELPFDSASMRMITVFRDQAAGTLTAMAKGAPRVILEMCSEYASGRKSAEALDDAGRQRFLAVNEEMAGRGLRVLAIAEKAMADESGDIDAGYTFLGVAGMSDPPRAGVGEAIEAARLAGIRIVMLTGDQAMTARAIARELRLAGDDEIFSMHASEVRDADDASLTEAARRVHVFSRVSPEDKLRIVELLQNAGQIVAVTGDGINDAPALKRADIGVAMGMRGTEVAKEAADIVLTDDNFSTIINAIEGGRMIYANITKFVHMMFSHNLGEVLVIFVAIITGLPLPLLPLQILWINIVTDIFPALALAVEPASPSTMKRSPRSSDENLLSGSFLLLIGWQGVMLAAITLSAYLWALNEYGPGSHARTVAMLGLVGVQIGHTFNCRSRTHSAFRGFFGNPYLFGAIAIVILLQLSAIYVPALAQLLGLVEPNWKDLIATLGCVILPIALVEMFKSLQRRHAGRDA